MRTEQVALLVGVLAVLNTTTGGATYLSPESLAAGADGKTLYVTAATADQVLTFDAVAGRVVRAYPLPDPPGGLTLSADGARLYVTGAVPTGRVHAIDLRAGQVTASISVGHTPVSPVLAPDGKTLYVCNRFNDNVGVIDLEAGRQMAVVPVAREPVAASITPDGMRLFVANLLPAGSADTGDIAAVVSVIDTADRKVVAAVRLPNGSTSVQGVCVSPDGKFAYAVHTLGRYQLPTTQLDRGWVNTSALSIIDVSRLALVNTVLLDDIDLGAANPWAVACTPDGKWLCVSHAGTHEISIIDRARLHEKLTRATAAGASGDAPAYGVEPRDNLAFLVDLRRRVKLAGNGPRGLVVAGSTVYVAEYFTDSIGVADIGADVRGPAKSLPLGPRESLSAVRRGEMLFHDATICFQHWQSCASCHPGGGRVDGLNWDLLNDGIGSPRSAKSLLRVYDTPPAMSLGVRANAKLAVRAGLTHVLFAVRPEEDAAALDEYLKSLKPVPSPHLVNGELSPAAQRGKTVFADAGCARCHPAPLYTDLRSYEVGTGRGADEDADFDTPTLIEIWRTAPYLHDGRAATMEEVLTKYNPSDEHGVTSGLSAEQLNDLIEFVLSQ